MLQDYYFKLMSKLMTFPVYTVSAINGHYFAGGFCLSQVSFTDFYPARVSQSHPCVASVPIGESSKRSEPGDV